MSSRYKIYTYQINVCYRDASAIIVLFNDKLYRAVMIDGGNIITTDGWNSISDC
jgi:hypothetical protein